MWTVNYWGAFAAFVGFAIVFGTISCSVTLLTKSSLPAAAPGKGDKHHSPEIDGVEQAVGKSIYLAAGSGIPEIKTILSGFVIPNFLDFKVLAVKAFGAVFAVATGMCLGKEGPFVHISTCVAYLVGMRFSKYRENGRKMRELLSAGCASGLSVAFGAPIGGVLFAYEVTEGFYNRKSPILTLQRKSVPTFLERFFGVRFSARFSPLLFSRPSTQPARGSLPYSRPTMALPTKLSTTWCSYSSELRVVYLAASFAKQTSYGQRPFGNTPSSRIILFWKFFWLFWSQPSYSIQTR